MKIRKLKDERWLLTKPSGANLALTYDQIAQCWNFIEDVERYGPMVKAMLSDTVSEGRD